MEAGHAVTLRSTAALLSLGLATFAGAALAGDNRIEACEERCEERFAECESKAEANAVECARKISDDSAWIACECEADGTPVPHCKPVCEKGDKAAAKCEAKLEKALERCQEKSDTCTDRCSD